MPNNTDSGLIGEYMLEEHARIPVEVEYASEFRYRKPILTDGDVVIAGDTGEVRRVTPEGEVVWGSSVEPTTRGIHGTPAVANGTVYVGAYDGALYAFDLDSGERFWRVKLGDAIGSSPGYYDGTVYIAVEYDDPSGALFGIGMVLARGCASRLLVLSATGNLRALLSGLIFAVTAQASLRGILAPLRDQLAGLWTVSGTETLNLLNLFGTGPAAGPVLGALLLTLAVLFAWRNRIGPRAWAGALGVGATVAFGWLFTYSLSWQSFGVVQVESMSFTGPSADVLMLILSPPGGLVDFDIGLVPGVFLGSLVAAVLARELKLEGFQGGLAMRRYIVGAVLMGFGGMLAGGCAVGAGISGGAVFALTAWLTLTAMWAGAALTHRLVDAPAGRPAAALSEPAAPA